MALIQNKDRVVRSPGDEHFICELCDLLGRLLVPSQAICASKNDTIALPLKIPLDVVEDVLSILATLCTLYSATLNVTTLVAVAAYAGNVEELATEAAALTARQLLHRQLGRQEVKADFITSAILQDFMRPISMPTGLGSTTSNQRAMHHQRHTGLAFNSAKGTERAHWKALGAEYCISIFLWAMAHSDVSFTNFLFPSSLCRLILVPGNTP